MTSCTLECLSALIATCAKLLFNAWLVCSYGTTFLNRMNTMTAVMVEMVVPMPPVWPILNSMLIRQTSVAMDSDVALIRNRLTVSVM